MPAVSYLDPWRALGVRVLLTVMLVLVVGLVAAPSSAHTLGVSRGEYRRVPAGLEASLSFAKSELAPLGSDSEVAKRIEVRSRDGCRLERATSAVLERDGVRIDALYRCRDDGPLHVSLVPLLRELSRGHRHEAVNVPNGTSTLLFEAHPELVVPMAELPPGTPSENPTRAASLPGFARLGIEHILTGFDHLVFLLGLVVVGLGARRTVVVASAFALAHSISLAACVLGSWTPPGSIVEPAIALSIAYVGVENLVARSQERRDERRAWLAFAFGLVHGTGFASALADVNFRGIELVVSLAGFNAGVELGQLLVLALLIPLLAVLRGLPVFTRYGVPAVSTAVAASGALWFLTRLYGLA